MLYVGYCYLYKSLLLTTISVHKESRISSSETFLEYLFYEKLCIIFTLETSFYMRSCKMQLSLHEQILLSVSMLKILLLSFEFNKDQLYVLLAELF